MHPASNMTTCVSHYPTGGTEDALALTGGLTEIRTRQAGNRALALVLPALARLSQERRWLAWIAPPDIPAGPLLAAAGVDLSRILVVHPRACADGLRAVEQALRSGTCGAVLAWLTRADDETLHRLRSAAEDGHSWGVMFHSV
ncbi:MAG TPA: hypothetical protein ENI94_09270 [Gammaproteobacteria bacterium]|nr:hypothetical protein [Gammaproteobacteria bacterium]